jgi:hypothetical protein
MKLDEKNQHEIISLLDPDPRFDWGEGFQSFIAIRRTGVMSFRDFRPALVKDSYARAQRIGALLGLILLAENSHGQTCCLVEQLHRRELRLGMIDIEGGGFSYQGGSGGWSNTICDPRRNHNLSRDDLKKIIFKEPFEALTAILYPQKPSVPRSLRKAVEQSAIRLADALHFASASARLLGAVTSIEILISNHGDSYDSNLQRLSALLGEGAIIQYNAKSVLRARHLYVHKGEEIEDYDLPMKAIGLALSCLLRYAEATRFFKDKDSLVEYLDFVYHGQRLSDNWNDAERKAFSELVKHNQKSHDFPFIRAM